MNQTAGPLSYKLLIALTIYLTSLFAANTLGLKIMPMPFDLHLSVAIFSFPIVFLMTDVIGHVYGRVTARMFVLAGFISTALFIAYSLISLAMPWSPDGEWAREGYNMMFGVSARIAVASLLAFVIAEYQDVLAFFFFRNVWTPNLWVTSMLSNLWSQFLDSAIFMVVAFYGIYETNTLISIIVSWWLFKVAMGVLYSPLLYVGVHLLKEE